MGLSLERIGQPGAGGGELGEDIMGGAVEDLLLGQYEAAGMAMEQRHLEVLLERADLAADRRLQDEPRSWPAWVKLPASATV